MTSEALPTDPSPADSEVALASRLDHLEHVLRDELARQKQRADRAESQLRALGELDQHADELVTAARAEATKILEAARQDQELAVLARREAEDQLRDAKRQAAEAARAAAVQRTRPRPAAAAASAESSPTADAGPTADAAAPASALDEELLRALRDHLIDLGALQSSMLSETRAAVIKIIQASSQARGSAMLRSVSTEATLERARN